MARRTPFAAVAVFSSSGTIPRRTSTHPTRRRCDQRPLTRSDRSGSATKERRRLVGRRALAVRLEMTAVVAAVVGKRIEARDDALDPGELRGRHFGPLLDAPIGR